MWSKVRFDIKMLVLDVSVQHVSLLNVEYDVSQISLIAQVDWFRWFCVNGKACQGLLVSFDFQLIVLNMFGVIVVDLLMKLTVENVS